MTPMLPERDTAPSSALMSWQMMRNSVVLPVPFGPISAVLVPSETRKFTPFSSCRPSERK